MKLRNILGAMLGVSPSALTPSIVLERLGCVTNEPEKWGINLDVSAEDSGSFERRRGTDGDIWVRGIIASRGVADMLRYWGIEAASAHDFAEDMAANPGNVKVYINSPGGNIYQLAEMVAAVNERRRMAGGGSVVMVADGMAASAGATLFLTGSERRMDEFSVLMFHRANTALYIAGNALFFEREMRSVLQQLTAFDDTLIALIQRVTGKSPQDVVTMLENETWLSAAQALEQGFTDFVLEPPADADDGPADGAQPSDTVIALRSANDALRDTLLLLD